MKVIHGVEQARRTRATARKCRYCGKYFLPMAHNQRDCSLKCHHRFINRRRCLERAEAREQERRNCRSWEGDTDQINRALEALSLDPMPAGVEEEQIDGEHGSA